MRTLVIAGLLATAPAVASAEPQTWLLTVDRWGNAEHIVLIADTDHGQVSGELNGWPVTGRAQGSSLSLTATDTHGVAYRFEGRLSGREFVGSADYPDTSNTGTRATHAFRGLRLEMPEGPPGPRVYAPTAFSNTFTADLAPVMVIQPGDIVSTRTVDSGGIDEHGQVVALYGNPQTGPFFVTGAKSGDVLAVHIRRLRLNRDYADSLDGLTGRATSIGLASQASGLGARVRWRLDRQSGTARLDAPPENLKDYVVPVRPMLGGLGVAPDFGIPAQSAGDTGRWGGNMDFNQIGEGATVYLPVFQPGAMLFLGDGHALQGDGETTQWALETSLDVEFSVELLPRRLMAAPRIGTAGPIAVPGQAGSLGGGGRSATETKKRTPRREDGLSVSEASLILGTAAEYRVATLAGRNAGMALSLDKAMLRDVGSRRQARTSPTVAAPAADRSPTSRSTS